MEVFILKYQVKSYRYFFRVSMYLLKCDGTIGHIFFNLIENLKNIFRFRLIFCPICLKMYDNEIAILYGLKSLRFAKFLLFLERNFQF